MSKYGTLQQIQNMVLSMNDQACPPRLTAHVRLPHVLETVHLNIYNPAMYNHILELNFTKPLPNAKFLMAFLAEHSCRRRPGYSVFRTALQGSDVLEHPFLITTVNEYNPFDVYEAIRDVQLEFRGIQLSYPHPLLAHAQGDPKAPPASGTIQQWGDLVKLSDHDGPTEAVTKAVCKCPIKDLLSEGHNPGCPEAR